MSIGSRIKEARKHKNWTQEELSIKIGVTKGAIANYENQVSTPKIEILFKLMQVLEVDANYIYQDDIKIPSQPIVVQSDLSIMSVQESLHLEKYRKLNTSGRQKADEQLDDLLLIAKYTEKDQSNIERDTAV